MSVETSHTLLSTLEAIRNDARKLEGSEQVTAAGVLSINDRLRSVLVDEIPDWLSEQKARLEREGVESPRGEAGMIVNGIGDIIVQQPLAEVA